MSNKSPSDANNDGPATKKLKASIGDGLSYSARITVLQSCGYAISSVHVNEFAKISAHNTASYHMLNDTGGASMQILNFPVEKTLVRFVAHWIYHRDATEAINASMNRQDEAQPGLVDKEWLIFLLKAMNFYGNRANFTCDITDSLVDAFLLFIASKSGLVHLDQVFIICKKHCKTITLTRIFANLFLHHRKQFVKQAPNSAFERCWVIS
ncbi:hypothetical protein KCU95_g3400, partial [Aureobasidium melanogenum]